MNDAPDQQEDEIGRLLSYMEERIRSGRTRPEDRAIWHLLKEHEALLPALPESGDLEGWHKQFRQVDVTGSGHADMAIWHLVHASHLFSVAWNVVTRGADHDPDPIHP